MEKLFMKCNVLGLLLGYHLIMVAGLSCLGPLVGPPMANQKKSGPKYPL